MITSKGEYFLWTTMKSYASFLGLTQDIKHESLPDLPYYSAAATIALTTTRSPPLFHAVAVKPPLPLTLQVPTFLGEHGMIAILQTGALPATAGVPPARLKKTQRTAQTSKTPGRLKKPCAKHRECGTSPPQHQSSSLSGPSSG